MLAMAVKAARAAGQIINRASLDVDGLRVTRKQLNDFVTEVDQQAEQIIIDTLLQAYPGHGIWAEESGRTQGSGKSEFVWIIDPLDGTTNFIHGLPIYCVSIALAHRGVLQHAVVYDPSRNDLFCASRGHGAFCNNRRIRVSSRTRLADGLIGTGFPIRPGPARDRYLRVFPDMLDASGGLRRPGAAALDLAYVAAGWYDGFFELGLHPWDVAAGALLVQEAGGLVGNWQGEADFLEAGEVVAAGPRIYAEMVRLLSPHAAPRPRAAQAARGEPPAAAPAPTPPAEDLNAAVLAAWKAAPPASSEPQQQAKPSAAPTAESLVGETDAPGTAVPAEAAAQPPEAKLPQADSADAGDAALPARPTLKLKVRKAAADEPPPVVDAPRRSSAAVARGGAGAQRRPPGGAPGDARHRPPGESPRRDARAPAGGGRPDARGRPPAGKTHGTAGGGARGARGADGAGGRGPRPGGSPPSGKPPGPADATPRPPSPAQQRLAQRGGIKRSRRGSSE